MKNLDERTKKMLFLAGGIVLLLIVIIIVVFSVLLGVFNKTNTSQDETITANKKLIEENKVWHALVISGFLKESFMTAKPKNNKPRPQIISPMLTTFSLLKNIITIPIKQKSRK